METHWKKITNPNYIGAYDFATGEVRKVKIISISQEKVYSPDNKMTDAVVAKLENSKPLVLCKTNMKMISKLLDTPFIEKWGGKSILLEVKKVKAFGEWVDALRVCDKLPTVESIKLEELTPTHPKWEAAKQALTYGKTTIEAIKKGYLLTQENEIELCKNLK